MKRTVMALVLTGVLLLSGCAQNGQDINNAIDVTASAGTTDNSSKDSVTSAPATDNSATNTVTEAPAATDAPVSAEPQPFVLKDEWLSDQLYTLADPAPANLTELKAAVDVTDPRSVAAYWVLSVNRLTENYNDGMDMMKYLFADIEPYGRGYTEGGGAGKAGWDSYFDERLKDSSYNWLPRAYFEGNSTRSDKFALETPLKITLFYNASNTETINEQTLDALGRLNIVYWVQSRAGNNQVNITLSRFEGTDRWYVTSGVSSSALFYMQ